ncbi:restriction endonuclease subunit S [Corynebacterium accolens]|uniref:restriction endonuclease subunit S n=1 Tax=Corynebacterium accolens TaxID=38284 RepID=UPI00266F3D26|nr:restriction endonuclease subunit S [Corynebacterium accolens]WKS67230.1 restriction endonuclease subunit S [Corynebacterium accolens]
MAETDSRIMPKLGLLSTTQSGSGFPPRMQGQTSKELPFYKVGSLSIVGEDGTINDSRNTISIDEAHGLKAAIVPSGSILMAKIGAALLLGRFVQTKFDCCIDNNMLALIPQKEVDPKYLHYATCLIDVTHLENPGPVPTLDINGLTQVRIPLPPLDTQRAIADYLDRETAEIDGMRADLDKMERLLKERRNNAIISMVGGENVESGSDSFRRYPKIKLDRVASAYQPKTISQEEMRSDGQFPVYGANGVIGRYQFYNHKDSEITVACRGATCGAVNVTAPFSWITGNAMVVKPRTQYINKIFMRFALEASDYELIVSGSAQPQITRETLYKLEVPLPSLTEQRRIADEIDRETAEIDSMLEDITKLRDLLAERRAAVISAAVTGQIDTPDTPTPKDEAHA